MIIKGESLLSLLIHPKTSEQLSILNATVTPTGKPIVAISNGCTYIFESEVSSWCRVANCNDPLNACTDLKPSAVCALRNVPSVAKIPRYVECCINDTMYHLHPKHICSAFKYFLSFKSVTGELLLIQYSHRSTWTD